MRFLPLNHIGSRRPEMAWKPPQTAGISFVSPTPRPIYAPTETRRGFPPWRPRSSLGQTPVGQRHQRASMPRRHAELPVLVALNNGRGVNPGEH